MSLEFKFLKTLYFHIDLPEYMKDGIGLGVNITHKIIENDAQGCKTETKINISPVKDDDKSYTISTCFIGIFSKTDDEPFYGDLSEFTIREIFPDIRAKIASIMAIIGISPLQLSFPSLILQNNKKGSTDSAKLEETEK
jgi:preprotein translocase subunit SecB